MILHEFVKLWGEGLSFKENSLLALFYGDPMAKDKKVTVAKGVKVTRGAEEKMREKKGSSNAGKYKDVSPKSFAGKSGGASKFSFPINTVARDRNALARAHYAPDAAGIRAAVYKKYPQLKMNHEKREGK
jgi:hypothetical protein